MLGMGWWRVVGLTGLVGLLVTVSAAPVAAYGGTRAYAGTAGPCLVEVCSLWLSDGAGEAAWRRLLESPAPFLLFTGATLAVVIGMFWWYGARRSTRDTSATRTPV
jgi:hypothetical protein